MILKNVEKNWVVQSNKLIEAKFNMTTNEHKLIRLLASLVIKGDNSFHEYQFKIKELAKLFGCNNKSAYRQFDKITDLLMSRYVKVRENNDTWIKYHVISSCKCANGILTIKIDNEMIDFFIELNRYTKYKLKNILEFKGKYSFRLYELLKQYEKLKMRCMSIDDLRNILDIPEEEYKIYHQLKQRVIQSAQKEINSKTDISFVFEEIKNGRKVVDIKFLIEPNINKLDQKLEIDDIQNQPNLEEKNIKEYEKIQKIISDFSKMYSGNLDYNLIKNLVKFKGIDCVEKCVTEFSNFVDKAKNVESTFYDFTKKYGTPEGYTKGTKYKNIISGKPIQATNYTQREYDDEFFDSLYKNLEYIKDDDGKIKY